MNERASAYVDEVVANLPPCLTARERIRADVEAHLAEYLEAGGTPEDAAEALGPPRELAERYAREVRLEPASLWDRTGAFLLDVALGADLVLVGLLLGRQLVWGDPDPQHAAFVAFGAAGVLLSILYFPVLEERYGQTLGKRVFGLCASRSGGSRLSLARAFVRRVPLFFEFFWLDALVAPFTEKRQRAFDLVADSVVVEADRRTSRARAWVAVLLALSPLFYLMWRGPLQHLVG